jgi:hypothetical protein
MAISAPSRGKPQAPTDTNQLDPGPIVDCPVKPAIGTLSDAKCKPGKFGGKILKVGRK